MSVEAITWAFRVPVGGSAKVVLIGLANHAHPDGRETYPSLDTLAIYAACDRATVRRSLKKLSSLGWIEEDGYGPHGTRKWRLRVEVSLDYRRECVYCGAPAQVMDHVVARSRDGSSSVRNLVAACIPCNQDKGSADVREWVESRGWDWAAIEARMTRFWAIDAGGGILPPAASRPQQATSKALPTTPAPPEPSKEPSKETVERPRAGAQQMSMVPPEPKRRPVTYRGRRVPSHIAAGAVRLLVVFTEATGRSHPPFTGRGEPTPQLKQVVGAMMAREDVSTDEWAKAIEAVAENPPGFVDGELKLGHVFGERAAEWALAAGRGEQRTSRNGGGRGGDRTDQLLDIALAAGEEMDRRMGNG